MQSARDLYLALRLIHFLNASRLDQDAQSIQEYALNTLALKRDALDLRLWMVLANHPKISALGPACLGFAAKHKTPFIQTLNARLTILVALPMAMVVSSKSSAQTITQ